MDLGERLVRAGLVDEDVYAQAIDAAERRGISIAALLVDEGHLAEDTLADVVARAIGTVVIDVELGALDRESVELLPERIARRHLMIAVARGPGGERLRVAFANPLDGAAVDAAREATGLGIDPLVATVGGVSAAIDREYRLGEEDDDDLPSEDTRQLFDRAGASGSSDAPLAPTATSPLFRGDPAASVEQRHEALLLALIEAGVLTRSDYLAALDRLKGRK